ncbi:SDR family NAD(P)-dependent oxidoreductase [Corynebacterium sp. S7]
MRTVVITGASDGIGAEAARQLVTGEQRLILVGRNPEKTKAVASEVGAEFYTADFADLDQVRNLASELNTTCDRIDVLANNAGGMFSGPTVTRDGFELTFQVNHLAPYLLTHSLMDLLIESRASVVNTSSIGARLFSKLDLNDLNTWNSYTPNRAYGNAKLANILFTEGLHERFNQRGLTTVAFHPGNVATNFAADTTSYFQRVYHSALRRFLISPAAGGARLKYFINGIAGRDWESGQYYYAPKRVGHTDRSAYDQAVVDKHWERSAEMLKIEW